MLGCMKRIICLLLLVSILVNSIDIVYADEGTTEWYELQIVEQDTYFEPVYLNNNARSRYISAIITRIADLGDGEVAMRADVQCYEDMLNITTIYYLQKVIDGMWETVGSITVSTDYTYSTSKTVLATGVTPGTYRAKTSTKVIHPSGQFELANGYSGAIDIE